MTEISGGITGAVVMEVSGAERLVYEEMRVAFDPSLLYRVRARVKNTVRPSGSLGNLLRVGVEGVASDGRQLVGTDGSNTIEDQYFVAASDYDMDSETLDEWVEFTGYVRGQGAYSASTGPASPSGVDASVAYVQPVVWVNMPDGDGTTQVGEVILDVLPEDATQIKVGSITVHQALEQDPDLIDDHSYSGRTAILTIKSTVTPSFGKVLTTSIVDGKLLRASLYNRSTNGFLCCDLGLGTGKQRVALPGCIVRDDSWSWMPGRTVFLSETAGSLTQTEPLSGLHRLPVGTAIASNLLYFNPVMDLSISTEAEFTSVIVSSPHSTYGTSIYQWTDGAIYVGTDGGVICRSTDYGVTWETVFESTEALPIVAFAPMNSSLYAASSGSTGFEIHATSDGETWSTIHTSSSQPEAFDLAKDPNSELLAIATGDTTTPGVGKILTSSDGTTWTVRYTSSCYAVVRLCPLLSTGLQALEAIGSTARALSTVDLTSWTVRATYTGYTDATDIFYYLNNSYAIVNGNRIYGGTTYPSTLQKSDAGYEWYRFFLIGSTRLVWGYNDNDGTVELWKGSGTSWDLVSVNTFVVPHRAIVADDGQAYFVSNSYPYFYRIARLHSLVV